MNKILGITGIKNSGKTTLITKLIPLLKEKGIKVGTLKHDGHDFEPDVPDTDSYLHRKSGAEIVAIYSDNRFMVIEERQASMEEMLENFKDVDLVLLEGFKNIDIPKIEIVRRGVSNSPYCKRDDVIAYVSDCPRFCKEVEQFGLEDIKEISEFIYNFVMEKTR